MPTWTIWDWLPCECLLEESVCGESRMGEISMSGLTRERGATVIGLSAFQPVLSSLLYRFNDDSIPKPLIRANQTLMR